MAKRLCAASFPCHSLEGSVVKGNAIGNPGGDLADVPLEIGGAFIRQRDVQYHALASPEIVLAIVDPGLQFIQKLTWVLYGRIEDFHIAGAE